MVEGLRVGVVVGECVGDCYVFRHFGGWVGEVVRGEDWGRFGGMVL